MSWRGSTTPTVVTSPVGCPRFSVSQAVSSGLVPFTASVLVYGLLELGEFPTEPVTSEAHPYSLQAKVKRKFHYRLLVQGRIVAVLGQRLQQCSFCNSVVSFLSCTSLPRGQLINPSKSCFMISYKAPPQTIARIKRVTGFKRQRGSMVYLGVPLQPGRVRAYDFSPLIDKINSKLASWKPKLLSQAGRITLINSVLASLPMYLAASSTIPSSIIRYIDKCCACFFWNGPDGVRLRQWVAWSTIQRPIAEDGLGIRSIKHVQLALAIKSRWNIHHGSSLWAQYARSRYLSGRYTIPECLDAQKKTHTKWKKDKPKAMTGTWSEEEEDEEEEDSSEDDEQDTKICLIAKEGE
ncbi:hypothetical protein Taro_006948 [Colocasia esculenta]|uniref:Uncharacterized protein n=1 Tax=Colocasia esculenta TaxID=4460 RepID=A0A843TQ40_COLES|nr:hypothetical protein [Colocasia esculenta]